MMTIQEQVKSDIKDAMRAKEADKLLALRGLSSAFTNEVISLERTPQDPITDQEAIVVVKREIKRRRDAAQQYLDGGRQDLADVENAELEVLEKYMPEMMPRDAILEIAKRLVAEGNDNSGKLMGMIIKECAGNADGVLVKEIVTELLG